MAKPIIEVKGLSKKYSLGEIQPYYTLRDSLAGMIKNPFAAVKAGLKKDEFWALKDINFTVNKGEVVGIIGRNGAGKSTLLKILSQITPPTEGEVILRGRVGSLLEVGTGFSPELTGRENIYLNGAVLGMKRAEVKKKFDEIVNFAEVEKFLDTPLKRYSSGMYMRLAFAVAAHLEPEILIVDEVLAVGDAEFQKKCLGKMGEVAGEGRTVLFVSHNMGAISTLCNSGILIHDSTLTSKGSITEIIKTYASTSNLAIHKWQNVKEIDHDFDVAELGFKFSKDNCFSNSENISLLVNLNVIQIKPHSLLLMNITRDQNIVFSYPIFLKKYGAGKVKLEIQLPNHFFNSGTYDISLEGSLYCDKGLFIHSNILSFSIYWDKNFPFKINDSHRGVTFPQLKIFKI